MKTENVRGRSGIVGKLDALVKDFSLDAAIVWLRDMFSSFETSSAKDIPIGDNKNERSYFASARLVGQVSKLPEKVGGVAVNRPLVVVAAEMLGDMTERTSRAVQFSFAKRVLRDAVGLWSTGLEGIPSQGLFFFYDGRGSFRFSLVSGEVDGRRFKFNEAKRQSFFVRPDAANNIIRRRFPGPIKTFAELKDAFSVEQLTKEFYRELFNWYEWAKDSGVRFPNVLNEPKDAAAEKLYNHEAVIRMVTRLMFTWFIRQRNLVPSVLFDKAALKDILVDFDDCSMDADNYYRAILQNLFFATFNTPQSGKDKLTRRWINVKTDAKGNGTGLTSDYHVTTVYRYRSEFKEPDAFLEMMRKVPFLNCALFDCLDRTETGEDGARKMMYFDGFSMRQQRRAHVPNGLFFGDSATGRMGIITLFGRYEFTIDENEVNDGDVALDPELLGKVFENLLGAYNPETQDTARKATGSFYTPREIVDYMVEESLKSYLRGKLALDERDSRLDELFDKGKAAEKAPTGFSRDEEKSLLEALYGCRIIDPACGSGAFPMGILNCMTRLLKRLDDDSGTSIREYLFKRYKEDKAKCDPSETEQDRQERLEELEKRFSEGKLYPDYARKLYLIENCIYGVDIQPIAAQISKLRFFISLLCDQFRTSYNPDGENYGLLSLPNLEAKFVCANTLMALPDVGGELDLNAGKIGELRDALVLNRHKIFGARSTKTKERYKEEDRKIRQQIREAVRDGLSKPDQEKVALLEAQINIAVNERKKVETPDWQEVKRPVQQDFFASTTVQPTLINVDRNADKRAEIDREIDDCKRAIAAEMAKGGQSNVLVATKYADLVAGWDPFDQNASSPFFDAKWMFNISDGFDVVIGNPPYFQMKKGIVSSAMYPYSEGKDNGKQNIYKLFVELSYNLLKEYGTSSLITQSSLLCDVSAQYTRELLLTKTRLRCAIEFPKNAPNKYAQLFQSALVGTSICIFRKEQPREDELMLISANNDLSTVRKFDFAQVKQSLPLTFYPKGFSIPLIGTMDFPVMEKMYAHSCFFSEYINFSSQGDFNLTNEKQCFNKNRTNVKMLRGCHVHRFHIDEQVEEFVQNNYKSHLIDFNLTHTSLVCQQISGMTDKHRFNFAVSHANRCLFGNSVNKIVLKDESLSLFMLAILNSNIIDWLFRKTSTNNHINIYEIEQLPIPSTTEKKQVPVIALVDRIITAKKKDPQADTAELEAEIDKLVYNLYGLTENEIRMIEGNENNSAKQDAADQSPVKPPKQASRPKASRRRHADDDDYLE